MHYGLKGLQTGDAAYRGSLEDPSWEGDARFCETLALLEGESKPQEAELLARLVRGPLADALTHTGQLTLLRRLAGAPVAGENFRKTDIRAGQIGLEASPETEL